MNPYKENPWMAFFAKMVLLGVINIIDGRSFDKVLTVANVLLYSKKFLPEVRATILEHYGPQALIVVLVFLGSGVALAFFVWQLQNALKKTEKTSR